MNPAKLTMVRVSAIPTNKDVSKLAQKEDATESIHLANRNSQQALANRLVLLRPTRRRRCYKHHYEYAEQLRENLWGNAQPLVSSEGAK
jgi:hypothetical protein